MFKKRAPSLPKVKINFRVTYTLVTAILILATTYFAIQYAKGGYRLGQKGLMPESGLLSANSFPPGAQVFIDDKLVTATDDTVYLEPGDYTIKIVKEGFSPWEKLLHMEKEHVVQTNAQLFPSAPGLTPLTFTGVENINTSPDGQKLVYYTASASTKTKNGLYVLELNSSFIPLQKGPKQIAEDNQIFDLANAHFIWSPDSAELMVLSENREVLIDISKKNILGEQPDITYQKKQILSIWEEEMYLKERQFLAEFPEEIIEIATQSAKNAYISPDKKRLLYTATEDILLPENIVPPLPGSNTQVQERLLKKNSIYIYDREEDTNFKIAYEGDQESELEKHLLAQYLYNKTPLTLESSPSAFTKLQATQSAQLAMNFDTYHTSLNINTLQWYTDSKHLMFVKNNNIHIMEYDGTNNTSVYSGPFFDNFIYPWPDGSRVIILTSFSPDAPKNLYAIELK